MADYDSGLPIRSEADGADERVHVKIVDYTTPANGTTVDTDGNVHVEVHGNNPAGTDEVLRLSQLGAPNPDGVYEGTDNTKPAHVGNIAHVRAAAPADTDLTQRITAVTGATDTTHHSMDVSIHDGDGDAIDDANPLPVKLVTSTIGDVIQDFKQATAVASDASDTHTYSVSAGKAFTLTSVQASASGKIKAEIRSGTPAATDLICVMFNSTANPNVEYVFSEDHIVAAEDDVEIVITNLDNQAQNVYSLIEGEEN